MFDHQNRRHKLDIIAIGASAGGVEAICSLLKHLPAELPATIVIVLHRPTGNASALQEILARVSHFHVVIPHWGEVLKHGVCYIGLPERHLIMAANGHWAYRLDGKYRGRNIDELFYSLAQYSGGRTIGVILSGLLKDGSAGLKAIKEAGGWALVQSPDQAAYPDMPRNAIQYDGPIDFVGPIEALAVKLKELIRP